MYLIFMDESGDISFSPDSDSKYFTITCLTIGEAIKNKIKDAMRHKKKKLYKLGWPRNVEIKATNLHGMKHDWRIPQDVKDAINGDDYIVKILESIKYSCQPRIDHITINKGRIRRASLRRAEYGIAYNYFSWELLRPMLIDFKNCKLIVDPKNKERHSKRHFEGYIETEVLKLMMGSRLAISFGIEQPDSHTNLGLQAVDFFSWSINRYVTGKGSQFYNIFKDLIVIGRRWYC